MRLALTPTDIDLALVNSNGPTNADSAVILGSDPDSACGRWHRLQRFAESGSDPNITEIRRRPYRTDSCQRLPHMGYSLILYIKPKTFSLAPINSLDKP
jgi:hypothetical protein